MSVLLRKKESKKVREQQILSKELEICIKDTLLEFPWLTYIARKVDYVENREVGSVAATNGKIITLYKEFYKSNRRKRMGILLHELFHIILEHISRAKTRNPRKWNIACDIVVDLLIFDLLGEEFYEVRGSDNPFINEEILNRLFKREVRIDDLRNMSAEDVYALLRDSLEFFLSGIFPDEKMELPPSIPYENGDDSSNALVREFVKSLKVDSHDSWYELSEEERKEAEDFAREGQVSIKLSSSSEYGFGNVPQQVGRQIDKLSRAKLNWRYLLREVVTDMLKGNYTWIPPNPRYLDVARDVYLPRYKYSWRGLSVGIAIDTSGSMSESELSRVISYLYDLLCQYDVKIRIVCCDCEVTSDVSYYSHRSKKGEVINNIMKSLKGGGGTSFEPAIKKFIKDEKGRKWGGKILFYFTDGDGHYPHPKEVPFTVIWLLTKGDRDVPFGKKILLEVEEDAV